MQFIYPAPSRKILKFPNTSRNITTSTSAISDFDVAIQDHIFSFGNTTKPNIPSVSTFSSMACREIVIRIGDEMRALGYRRSSDPTGSTSDLSLVPMSKDGDCTSCSSRTAPNRAGYLRSR